jgi:DNA-binding response OmpR family regulator
MHSEPYGYLSKPFRDAELKTTLHTAWCKHTYFCAGKEGVMRHKNCDIALPFGYRFDKIQGVLLQEGKAVKLTGNEIKFFQILSEQPGNTVSFEHISAYIWREPYIDPSRLRNLIYRLRQKVHGELLENVFEAGYRLNV